MNERIKELMKEADAWHFNDNRGQFSLSDYSEKFAELIVKECVEIAHQNGDNVEYLQQHFGIEE